MNQAKTVSRSKNIVEISVCILATKGKCVYILPLKTEDRKSCSVDLNFEIQKTNEKAKVVAIMEQYVRP